jgi:hypothetical protein
MLQILLHHWATYLYLGWLLVVILANVLTWKNGGNVLPRKPLPRGDQSEPRAERAPVALMIRVRRRPAPNYAKGVLSFREGDRQGQVLGDSHV